MTNIKIELISDSPDTSNIDLHLFMEKGIRGGVAVISHRHANNPLVEGYDAAQPTNHLIYWDANNLYGWAMSQPLPYAGLRWLMDEEIRQLDITNVSSDASEGYILEVDLNYPVELHHLHEDYPLAPEKMKISFDMLSPFQLAMLADVERIELNRGKSPDEHFIGPIKPSVASVVEKLVPNLCDKTQYILHYRNLQLYLSLGMELTRIHRVVAFKQKAWLAPYIEFNTLQRAKAANDFEKDFFKLLNNAVFGKLMENVRHRRRIDLITDSAKLRKFAAQPTFKCVRTFNKDLVSLERYKPTVVLNKPIFIGLTVLELSKVLMYDFHYGAVKSMYGSKATLLFTDTDSLCYSIETDDVYTDMLRRADLFDFSNYPANHPNYSTNNKKVIGKMKDELGGAPMTEFVGLRAKLYAFCYRDGEEEREIKKCKGVGRAAVKHELLFQHYKRCLLHQEKKSVEVMAIRSSLHRVNTICQRKVALASYDDKRYMLDSVCSLPYGHFQNV